MQKPTNINQEVHQLFVSQCEEWQLLTQNYNDLREVESRKVNFPQFEIVVQFNPKRVHSSGAKIDAKSIAARPCFLCATNRPAEQRALLWETYEILVNPYPILPEHFTIVSQQHIPQTLSPHLDKFLTLAQAMDNYLLFYNGAKCGASAPDHHHFQGGTKDFFPLLSDYRRLKLSSAKMVSQYGTSLVYEVKDYLRRLLIIESKSKKGITEAFTSVMREYNFDEAMINVVLEYSEQQWFFYLFPRQRFRPWQFDTAEESKRLMISPATVEMSGVIICPMESDFRRLTKADIEDIFKQL